MSQTSVGVDFTLETVQYKFATIIGELCGKPSILSQFAVWLDLRLSEYKLKGSISLDCSGLKPDPDWLQGLKDSTPPWNPHPLSDQHGESRQSRERQRSGQRVRQSVDLATPSDVVIKEEGSDLELDFPVSSDRLNSSSQFLGRIERKRSFHDSNTSLSLPGRIEQTGIYKNRSGAQVHGRIERTHHSSVKQKLPSKSSSHTSSVITSLNNFSESTVLPTQENSPSQTSFCSDLNTNSQSIGPDNAISAYSRGNNSADCSSTGAVNSSAFAEDSVSEPSLQKILNIQSPLADEQSGMSTDAVGTHSVDLDYISDNPNRSMLTKLGIGAHRSPKAMKKRRGIRSVEVFLQSEPISETRSLEAIPPEELDAYLAKYFTEIKPRDGRDYHPLSLNAVRSNLESYLQERGYGWSIVRSSQFYRSQSSFRSRTQELKRAMRAKEGKSSDSDNLPMSGEQWTDEFCS